MYQLLVHEDIDINAKDNDGHTAYCAAISQGHTEIQNMFEEVAGDKVEKDCSSDTDETDATVVEDEEDDYGLTSLFEES